MDIYIYINCNCLNNNRLSANKYVHNSANIPPTALALSFQNLSTFSLAGSIRKGISATSLGALLGRRVGLGPHPMLMVTRILSRLLTRIENLTISLLLCAFKLVIVITHKLKNHTLRGLGSFQRLSERVDARAFAILSYAFFLVVSIKTAYLSNFRRFLLNFFSTSPVVSFRGAPGIFSHDF